MASVLVIDDEAEFLEAVDGFLNGSGFTVLTASDGRRGLEVFTRGKPDLVLCALEMPGVGGLQVLAEVCRLSPQTPIALLGRRPDLDPALDALRRGAWDYLLKPLPRLDALLPLLERLEEKARLVRQKDAEQVALLAELNHRVKNNLQVILVLLGLQQELSGDPAAQAALAESQRRLHALALVQDELHDAARGVRVPASDFVGHLVHHFLSALGLTAGLSLDLEVAAPPLSAGRAFSCGLILHEMLNGLGAPGPGREPWTLGLRVGPGPSGCLDLSLRRSYVSGPQAEPVSAGPLLAALVEQEGGTILRPAADPAALTVRLP